MKTVKERMEEIKVRGIQKVVFSYKDSGSGRGVLVYQNESFSLLLVIGNDPRLMKIRELTFEEGLFYLEKIQDKTYSLQVFQMTRVVNGEQINEMGWA